MMNHVGIPHEGNITSYYKPSQQLERLGREMHTFTVSPKYCVPLNGEGQKNFKRISFISDHVSDNIQVENGDVNFGRGSVVDF